MDNEADHVNFDRLSRDELADRRADVKRELARVERQQRKDEKDFRFLQSMVKDIERMDEMGWEELIGFRAKLQRLIELGKEKDEPTTQEYNTILAGIAMIEAMIEVRRQVEGLMRDTLRGVKLREKRAKAQAEQPAQEPLCIVCKKRPRHFDDYCKRCVPDELRPKGKI